MLVEAPSAQPLLPILILDLTSTVDVHRLVAQAPALARVTEHAALALALAPALAAALASDDGEHKHETEFECERK